MHEVDYYTTLSNAELMMIIKSVKKYIKDRRKNTEKLLEKHQGNLDTSLFNKDMLVGENMIKRCDSVLLSRGIDKGDK